MYGRGNVMAINDKTENRIETQQEGKGSKKSVEVGTKDRGEATEATSVMAPEREVG
jgi:hypothetical protein